jgi:hypothetical protein
MSACGRGVEYLPVVKMLLNHPKIEVNHQNKVIIIVIVIVIFLLTFLHYFILVW